MKTATWLLSILVLGTSSSGLIAQDTADVVPGDLDGDRAVTAFDAFRALRYSSGAEPIPTQGAFDMADVDAKGDVNSFDAVQILGMASGERPAARVSASPVYGAAPLVVTFTAQVGGGKPPYRYAWDFNNDSVTDSTNPSPVFTFSADSDYPVHFVVQDAGGRQARADFVVTVDSEVPPAPVDFNAIPGDGYALLRWKNTLLLSNAVVGCNVYRQQAGETGFQRINTIPATAAYWDRGLANGSNCVYYIRLLGYNYLEGPPSPQIAFTAGPRLSQPRLLSCSASNSQVTLAWSPVPGATGYNLYRYDENPEYAVLVNSNVISDTTFSDSSLLGGVLYRYGVAAVDAQGFESRISLTRPAFISTLTDSDGDGMPDDWEIYWGLNPLVNDANLDPDADGLNNLEEYRLGANPRNADSDGDGLADGAEVRTYHSDPLNPDSDFGGQWDGPETLAGLNVTNALDDLVMPPTGLEVALSSNRLTVCWNGSRTPNVAGYNVYANALDGNGFLKLNGTPITEHRAPDVLVMQEDRLYQVRVCAVDFFGQESAASESVLLKGKTIAADAGGTLQLFDDSLTLPAGALDSTCFIALGYGANPSLFNASGKELVLLPHGLELRCPASLSLLCDTNLVGPGTIADLGVAYFSGERWVFTGETSVIASNRIALLTRHFSDYKAVINGKHRLNDLTVTESGGSLNVNVRSSGGNLINHLDSFAKLDYASHKFTGDDIDRFVVFSNPHVRVPSRNWDFYYAIEPQIYTMEINGRRFLVDRRMTYGYSHLIGPPATYGDFHFNITTTIYDAQMNPMGSPIREVVNRGATEDFDAWAARAAQQFMNFTVPLTKPSDFGIQPGDNVTVKLNWFTVLWTIQRDTDRLGYMPKSGFFSTPAVSRTSKPYPMGFQSVARAYPIGPRLQFNYVPELDVNEDDPNAFFSIESALTPGAGKTVHDYQWAFVGGWDTILGTDPHSATSREPLLFRDVLRSNEPDGPNNTAIGYYCGMEGAFRHPKVKVRVWDKEGNSATADFFATILNVSNNPSTLSDISGPTSLNRNTSATLSNVVDDLDFYPDDPALGAQPVNAVYFDWSGDGTFDAWTYNAVNRTCSVNWHAPNRTGVATVTCVFRDADGNAATSVSKNITLTEPPPPAPTVHITSPASGFSTSSRVFTVSGTVSDTSVSTVRISVNGRVQTANCSGGSYSSSAVLTSGANSITVSASNNGGTGSASVSGTCTAKPCRIWSQLTWDQDLADVDLHIYEPDGDHISYSNKNGVGGGHLDVDDRNGYGPEHYYISSQDGDTVTAGNYRFDVNYFDPHGQAATITGTLVVYKNESYYGTYSYSLTSEGQTKTLVTVTMP